MQHEHDSIEADSSFILDFYLQRCSGIPSLVLHGEYDAETAGEEIDLMIESVGRLDAATDSKRTEVIEKAMEAKAAVWRAWWFGPPCKGNQ